MTQPSKQLFVYSYNHK